MSENRYALVLYDLEHPNQLVGAIKFSRNGQNSVVST